MVSGWSLPRQVLLLDQEQVKGGDRVVPLPPLGELSGEEAWAPPRLSWGLAGSLLDQELKTKLQLPAGWGGGLQPLCLWGPSW